MGLGAVLSSVLFEVNIKPNPAAMRSKRIGQAIGAAAATAALLSETNRITITALAETPAIPAPTKNCVE